MPTRFDSFEVSDEDRARALRRRIAANPNDAASLYKLGFLLSRRDYTNRCCTEAISCLEKAVALGENAVTVKLRLGDLFIEDRRYESAEGVYGQVVATEPGNAQALRGLGVARLRQGCAENAREPLQRALELQQGKDSLGVSEMLVQIHFDLALVSFESGNFDQCVTDCRELLKLRPGHAEASVLLVRALLSVGKNEESVQAAQTAVSLLPDDWEPHYLSARALVALGKLDEARPEYLRALILGDDVAEVHYHWGMLLVQTERYFKAVEQFRRALALQPDMAEARHELADLTSQTDEEMGEVRTLAESTIASAETQLKAMADWGVGSSNEHKELEQKLERSRGFAGLDYYYAFEMAATRAAEIAGRAETLVRKRKEFLAQEVESARDELCNARSSALKVDAERYFPDSWEALEKQFKEALDLWSDDNPCQVRETIKKWTALQLKYGRIEKDSAEQFARDRRGEKERKRRFIPVVTVGTVLILAVIAIIGALMDVQGSMVVIFILLYAGSIVGCIALLRYLNRF